MGVHDSNGKNLIRHVAGGAFTSTGEPFYFAFGKDGGTSGIDGTVGREIAVEVESHTDKQVRGALLECYTSGKSRPQWAKVYFLVKNPDLMK